MYKRQLQDASQKPFGQKDSTRLERLETALRDTLGGTRVTELATSRMGRRQAAFLVQPSAQIRDDVSTEYTVVDIAGRDRPGLLYDVASVLANSGLSIHSAHVGSYGERMFDAFYVQTDEGQKLTEKARIETLKGRLLDALGQHEPDAPETPARKLRRSRAVDSF